MSTLSGVVQVWPSKFARGWDPVQGDRGAADCWPYYRLRDALAASFDTDAHFVPYVIVEPDGSVQRAGARVNKAALVDERTGRLVDGAHQLMTALIFDVDHPDVHKAAKQGARLDVPEDWRLAVADALERVEGWETLGVYDTRGGCRLVWELAEPVAPAQWRAIHTRWRGLLAAVGVTADRLIDPQRCYRLPFVLRDGQAQRFGADLGRLGPLVVGEVAPVEAAPAASAGSVFAGIEDAGGGAYTIPRYVGENRNSSLLSFLGMLRGRGEADPATLEMFALAFNAAKCDPPLDASEVRLVVGSVLRYPVGELAELDAPVARFRVGSEVEVTNYVLAQLESLGPVVADRGSLWRYSASDGVWRKLADNAVARGVADLDGAWIHVGVKKDGTPTLKPLKVSAPFAEHGETLARMLRAEPGYFDRAAAGVAFRNGFLRVSAGGVTLETLTLEHRVRERLEVEYRPGATPRRWLAFLESLFLPDDDAGDKIAFLRQWLGIALLGEATRYPTAVILLGDGENGKSTFLRVVRALFPAESIQSIAPQLLESEYRRALLDRCRLNVVSEMPGHEFMTSEAFKAVVSGDEIDAREIRQSPFTLKPRAAHLFAANKLPPVSGDQTHGFWRRWAIVGFNRIFGPGDADPNIADALLAEGGEIAIWALEGAVSVLQARRYHRPASSVETLMSWRRETNNVAMFVDECCQPDSSGTVASSLFGAYVTWAEAGKFRVVSSATFKERLEALGYPQRRTKVARFYPLSLAARPAFGVSAPV
jgi:P4 family phage/plasmid primase-like protien